MSNWCRRLLTPTNGPTLSVGDVSIVEGNSGAVSALFTVRLSEVSNQTVTVNFASADAEVDTAKDLVPSRTNLKIPNI